MYKKYIFSLALCGAFLAATAGAMTLEASLKTSATVEDTQVQSNTGVQIKTKDGSTIQVQTEPGTDTKSSAGTGASVVVRGWDPRKKEEVSTKLQTALENNPQIKSLEVSENSVLVNYGATAKILGFIPVTMPIEVTADANAKVMVKFPWWKFIATSDFSHSADDINAIFQHNQTDLEFLTKQAPEDRQVIIFTTISNALKANYDLAVGKKI